MTRILRRHPPARAQHRITVGIQSAKAGVFINTALAITKIAVGIVGHSFALVADGIESTADIGSSLIVWAGLRISGRSADDSFHFGYGKVDALAAATVALMLLGAAIGIGIGAVREILTPHPLPAGFTLGVLAIVIIIKLLLFRRAGTVGEAVESAAVAADAGHHRADAITSAAAFVGISVALVGGPGWEAADDYAALLASLIIVANGIRMLRAAARDLLDRAPGDDLLDRVMKTARQVPGVRGTEKLRVRKTGLGYHVELHVQADPTLPLRAAHALGGRVKRAIFAAVPSVLDAIIHMEPAEEELSLRLGASKLKSSVEPVGGRDRRDA